MKIQVSNFTPDEVSVILRVLLEHIRVKSILLLQARSHMDDDFNQMTEESARKVLGFLLEVQAESQRRDRINEELAVVGSANPEN